jgi:alpha-tubulin suppressor-like RCC1 family protein
MLGNGAAANSDIPVAVSNSGVLAGRTVTAIRNGIVNSGSHPNCAIADGEAFCWGLGTSGQLGNNASLSSNTPVAVDMSGVLSGLTVTDIAPGSTHTCALADNNVYCWGSDSNGRLGNGPAGSSTVPVATIAPSS